MITQPSLASTKVCSQNWPTNAVLRHRLKEPERDVGCGQVARRARGCSPGTRIREPGPEGRKGKRVREGSALQDRVCSAGPGPRNEGRIAGCCAPGRGQGRESFPNFHCCVCSSAGRLQTLPPFPHPLFSRRNPSERSNQRSRSGCPGSWPCASNGASRRDMWCAVTSRKQRRG